MQQSGVVGLTFEGNAERVTDFRDAPFCSQQVLVEMFGTDLITPDVVRGWVESYTVPTVKIGRRRVINLHRKAKDFSRINLLSGATDSKSRLFVDPGQMGFVDLSGVRLLRCGVDTVRQLYRGLIRPEIMGLFEKPGTLVDFAGQRWHSGRVGRDSGYQYKLQNADLGFILLVKNFNAKQDSIGPHLKIEVSPHAIDNLSPERLQARMDYYASQLLTHIEINQCAVHLALDLQGWTPPVDLVARLHCKAKTHRDITGINELHWHLKSSVYGRGETSMFGSASGVHSASTTKPNRPRRRTSSTTGKASGVGVIRSMKATRTTTIPRRRCGVSSCAITTPSSSSSPAARWICIPAR